MALYLGIFIFAEAAFIMMAIKEYFQDLLEIRDRSIIMRLFDNEMISSKSQTDAATIKIDEKFTK